MCSRHALQRGQYHRARWLCPESRRGAAVVETAILVSLLALLFGAAVDFARVYYYQLTIINCARNGAHFGSNLRSYQETAWVNSTDDVKAAAVADGAGLNPPLTTDQVNVVSGTGSDGNNNITVTVSYPFKTILTFPGFGNTINLQATVKMRVAP
jgi:Flp pilus assembly protein TadG